MAASRGDGGGALSGKGLGHSAPGRGSSSPRASSRTREHLDSFWELIDEILNAVLFVLIGLEVLVIELRPGYLLASASRGWW